MSQTTHTYSNNKIKNLKPFYNIYFLYNFFHIEKYLKIHQLNFIKKRKASKKGCERYQDLSEEEENKKQQYGCKHY